MLEWIVKCYCNTYNNNIMEIKSIAVTAKDYEHSKSIYLSLISSVTLYENNYLQYLPFFCLQSLHFSNTNILICNVSKKSIRNGIHMQRIVMVTKNTNFQKSHPFFYYNTAASSCQTLHVKGNLTVVNRDRCR